MQKSWLTIILVVLLSGCAGSWNPFQDKQKSVPPQAVVPIPPPKPEFVFPTNCPKPHKFYANALTSMTDEDRAWLVRVTNFLEACRASFSLKVE